MDGSKSHPMVLPSLESVINMQVCAFSPTVQFRLRLLRCVGVGLDLGVDLVGCRVYPAISAAHACHTVPCQKSPTAR